MNIPQRYITRPERWGDDLVENKHVTHDEFDKKINSGEIAISWERDLGEAIEAYGFASPDNKKLIHLYSANVALITKNNNLKPKNFLDNALVIAVVTDQQTRQARLIARSPDLLTKPRELEKRLADDTPTIQAGAHILFNNSANITASKQQFVELVSRIVQLKQNGPNG